MVSNSNPANFFQEMDIGCEVTVDRMLVVYPIPSQLTRGLTVWGSIVSFPGGVCDGALDLALAANDFGRFVRFTRVLE